MIAVDERSYRTPPFQRPAAGVVGAADRRRDGGGAGRRPRWSGWDIVFPTSAAVSWATSAFDLPLLQVILAGTAAGRIVLGATPGRRADPAQRTHALGDRAFGQYPLAEPAHRSGRRGRAVPLFVQRETDRRLVSEPAFALELANRHRRTGEIAPGLRAARDNALLLNFDRSAGRPADLFLCRPLALRRSRAGRLLLEAFAGKAVVFGTVLDVEDRVPSSARLITRPDGAELAGALHRGPAGAPGRPPDRPRAVPGVYLQATAVDNLLNGNDYSCARCRAGWSIWWFWSSPRCAARR